VISNVVVILTIKTELRKVTGGNRRVSRLTQGLLLCLQVTDVLIVHFRNAEDAHSCCEHEAELAHNRGNDPQATLPVKVIPYLNA